LIADGGLRTKYYYRNKIKNKEFRKFCGKWVSVYVLNFDIL